MPAVTFTQAYVEDAMTNRSNVATLDALEIWHPLFAQRIRFVNDHGPLFATLEATAPADASTEVEFLPRGFKLVPPEESDAASNPDWAIEVDDISGVLTRALKLTRGSLEPWLLTARVYSEDDLSGPAALPPTVVELRSVSLNGKTASMVWNYGDPGNVGIPALTFKRKLYPGLVR